MPNEEIAFTFWKNHDKIHLSENNQKERLMIMNVKKLICTALSAAMLLSAAYVPMANAWSIYDWDYGEEWNEQSKTAVTDDMEEYRQNDSLESLVYTIRDDGSAMITSYSAKFWYDPDPNFTVELNIPSEIDGHPVTAIGDGALRESATKISGITLPPTIKEIGNRAIYGRYLKYLKLNDGLEVIKDGAIDCGDVLETLVIPDSVKYIGTEAISGEALKSITMPNNLEYMGKRIFYGSAYDKDPANRVDGIQYHGQYLIAGIRIGYVEIDNPDPSAPTENKQIHEWEAVGDIAIREGTTLMGVDAFGMSNITSVKLPSTLKSISKLGFYWCKNLNNVVIPGTVKEIGDNAFSWCESLSNLTISEGVEHIGEAAFFRCNNLNEVTIPRSVTQIDMHAFGWDYVNDYDVRNENLVIKCYSGTAAEQYARDNGFKCVLIDTGEIIEKGEPTAAADDRYTCEEKGNNCAVKKFKDIKSADGDPDHNGIEFCLENGIMTGTSADTFTPDGTITRAQFATMFYRLAGSPETSGDSKFTDLTQDWYKKPVAWAAANGILNGTGAATFSPNATVTREQIAAIFYRYAQAKGLDVSNISSGLDSYNDYSEISDYAKTAVEWCFDENIMFIHSVNGYEYAIYPKVAPSRADTATMFWKFAYELNNN